MSTVLGIARQRLAYGLFLVAVFAIYTILNIFFIQETHPDYSLAESVTKGAMRSAGPFLMGMIVFVPIALLFRLAGRRFRVSKEELDDVTSGVHMWVTLLWMLGLAATAFVAEMVIAAIASTYV